MGENPFQLFQGRARPDQLGRARRTLSGFTTGHFLLGLVEYHGANVCRMFHRAQISRGRTVPGNFSAVVPALAPVHDLRWSLVFRHFNFSRNGRCATTNRAGWLSLSWRNDERIEITCYKMLASTARFP